MRVIPQQAIVQRSEVSGVYVQNKDAQLLFRQIRLGRHMADGQHEVLAGLSVGEQVVVDPFKAVRLLKNTSSISVQ